MAALVRVADQERWSPPAEAVVGRSTTCTLRLADQDVSKEHASIRWVGTGWEVRDLNSRNGTFVAGQRLGPRAHATLIAGAEIRFGGSSAWLVEDDGPPPPMAFRLSDRLCATATTRLLALPPGDSPLATIHYDDRGHWILEHDGRCRPTADGEVLELDGERWSLRLPTVAEATAEPVDPSRSLAATTLLLRTNANGQLDDVKLQTPRGDLPLRGRAFHRVLLLLAEARVEDTRQGRDETECGWRSRDTIESTLEMTRKHVNVAVHRIRRQLDDAGIIDAQHVIQRRGAEVRLSVGVDLDTAGGDDLGSHDGPTEHDP